jgi:uncharacterized protein YecE (DUF72 family)
VPAEVRYGTAGWSFPDWYGPFYPTPSEDSGPGSLFTGVLDSAPDPDVRVAKREPLRYYARYFDTVEINSSFYGVPSVKSATGWLDATERSDRAPFLFSLKLPQLFSHHGDLDPREVEAFKDCLAPIRERGRLLAVLAQFPQQFALSLHAGDLLKRIREAFPDVLLAVEVRHRSWDCQAGWGQLAELEACAASIDMPQGRHTLGPTTELTNPELAYVRLHGRNADAWFDRKAGRDQKYDYLYEPAELDEWAARIEEYSQRAKRVVVIANNHYRGKAPANALELRGMREGSVSVPSPLARTYGRLAQICSQ